MLPNYSLALRAPDQSEELLELPVASRGDRGIRGRAVGTGSEAFLEGLDDCVDSRTCKENKDD